MAQSTVVKVKNNTGSTLNYGKAVYVTGFDDDSQVVTVALSSADDLSTMPSIGVLPDDIISGDIGTVKMSGLIGGINTENVSINTPVYLGYNGSLSFEDLSASDSNVTVQRIGVVVTVSEDSGQILVFPSEIYRRVTHNELLGVSENQHHSKLHADNHYPGGADSLSTIYLPRDGSLGMNNTLGVGTNSPDQSAALEISSPSKGFLPPRLTTEQRNAISSPASGLVIYNTTNDAWEGYNGASWVTFDTTIIP